MKAGDRRGKQINRTATGAETDPVCMECDLGLNVTFTAIGNSDNFLPTYSDKLKTEIGKILTHVCRNPT